MSLPEMQYLRNRETHEVKCAGHINYEADEQYEVVLGFPVGKWENEIVMPKPTLNGKELTGFIRSLFKEIPFEQRVNILSPVSVYFQVLSEDPIISKADYDSFKGILINSFAGKLPESTITGTLEAVSNFLLNYEELI